jgi:ATP-dependent protease HslVU (ClpYQ) peptidase subunit
MTTLVYRAGVLAADSRWTVNDTIVPGDAVKVRKIDDGRLVGFTGAVASSRKFISRLESGEGELPELTDACVVVVSADGKLTVYEADGSYSADDADFYAWGSGIQAALAVLHTGVSAEEAVRIACLVDSRSGGPVRSVKLDKPSSSTWDDMTQRWDVA